MITSDVVHRRINDFWGYCTFDAPVWFVGMEEGLGDEKDLEERFRAADGKTTIDIRKDMTRVPLHKMYFQPPKPPIQPTWKYPITLYLYLKNGRAPSLEEIRKHQLDVLGDVARKETHVIELMPLPARSTAASDWPYQNCVGTRQQYLAKYKLARVRQLRTIVATHPPRLVIFHSLTYLTDWECVIGLPPTEVTPQMYFASANETSYYVIPYANSRGMSYKRLYQFAERVRSQVSLT
jgi:hypothetical protein